MKKINEVDTKLDMSALDAVYEYNFYGASWFGGTAGFRRIPRLLGKPYDVYIFQDLTPGKVLTWPDTPHEKLRLVRVSAINGPNSSPEGLRRKRACYPAKPQPSHPTPPARLSAPHDASDLPGPPAPKSPPETPEAAEKTQQEGEPDRFSSGGSRPGGFALPGRPVATNRHS